MTRCKDHVRLCFVKQRPCHVISSQYFLSISICASLVTHLTASFSHSWPRRPSLCTMMYFVSERQTKTYLEPEKATRSLGRPGSLADDGFTFMTYVWLQKLSWSTLSSAPSKMRLSTCNSNESLVYKVYNKNNFSTNWNKSYQLAAAVSVRQPLPKLQSFLLADRKPSADNRTSWVHCLQHFN